MRLPQRFYRLPVRFDVARLQAEIEDIPAEAWVAHPTGEPGNSAARLISVGGGDNDQMHGAMGMTRCLERLPYVRQILAGFGVVWSRARLLRLARGAEVKMHADIYHHWFYRTRVHFPVKTLPSVEFTCDGESVHMAAGECWIFDNWRQHAVRNPTDSYRIHLVADTSGDARFWELVARGRNPAAAIEYRPYQENDVRTLLMERCFPRAVMSPEEMELLVLDIRSELTVETDTSEHRARLAQFHALLLGLVRDWRHLYLLHGEGPEGRAEFVGLRERVRERSQAISMGLMMQSNHVTVQRLLEARILRVCVLAN
jgi:Aspartyl/Asparaginyl beta-hydroxylase